MPHMNGSPVRKDAPVVCAACGRRVARKSRHHKFCSDRCREWAKGQKRVRKSFLGEDTGASPQPPKTSNGNNKLQGTISGSNPPLNVLGGYRWSNSVAIEPDLLRKIVIAEIGRTT
jgi:endogenous inhibitor of DNA gyrase (YacG/DUF329 family)